MPSTIINLHHLTIELCDNCNEMSDLYGNCGCTVDDDGYINLIPNTPAALVSLVDAIAAEADGLYDGSMATEDLLDILVYADGLNGMDEDNEISDIVGEVIEELAYR